MDEKIEKKVGKELYNDLSSIMSEEYEKRMLITPSYCANKMLEKGYRKERDTAREIWDDCIDEIMRGCGDDKEFWVIKILIEAFKKYGVDLGD